VQYTHGAGGRDLSRVSLTASPILVGRTNPLLVASAFENTERRSLGQHEQQVFATGVWGRGSSCSDDWCRVRHQRLSSARLYTPLVQVNASYEAQFLDTNPSITVPYYDLFQYTVNDVQPQQEVNQLTTSGTVNPQQLVLTPLVNRNDTQTPNTDTTASPFTSEPGTTSALPQISNLQILVSGQAVFSNGPLDYSCEQFLNEVAPLGLNGNNSVGLCSGLLSEHKWDVDLSRRTPTDDGVAKSTAVQFRNTAKKRFDFLVFVRYGRSLTIETATGTATSS
jgi:hypothetical protein